MFAHLWPVTLVIALYSAFVSWVDASVRLETFDLPVAFASLPGAFVGVLLAFRTNSSYDRWWEARILWGRIVNDSRTWVRQLIAFTGEPDDFSRESVRRMAHRHAGWCYALSRSLRREPPLDDLADLVGDGELAALGAHTNVPNALLLAQARDLRALHERETIDTWQFVALDATLGRLTDSMGGCERIRNTPFPPHYSSWIHYLVYLFILLLPFSFVDAPAFVMTLVTVPVALGYLIVERVALYLETPFDHAMTGTPMSALSRTIEINIRQMLGETETPAALEPVDDILY
jgi:putative membrane protein